MSECNDTCKYYKHCWSRGEYLIEDGEECEHYEPERPHGEWVKKYNTEDPTTVCSVCGFDTEDKVYFNFCPNCGADMRKEGDEK